MKFTTSHWSLTAIDCIQRRREPDDDSHHLRLIVEDDGAVSVREVESNHFDPDGTLISAALPYGIDPRPLIADVKRAKHPLGMFIRGYIRSADREVGARSEDLQDAIDRLVCERYRSSYTFVTPDEWYEGAEDELPTEGSVPDLKREALRCKSRAWRNGYNGWRHAIIDVDDFVRFMSDNIAN